MKPAPKHKKNLIISLKNITDELRALITETYPDGYGDHIRKTIKPNGDTIFTFPLETEEISYMIKVDMKIDTLIADDDIDKDLYDDEEKDDENVFAPISEAMEKEEGNNSHNEYVLNYGSSDEEMEERIKKSSRLSKKKDNDNDLDDDDLDDEDLDDEDWDNLDDEDSDFDAEYEPSDDDLEDIANLVSGVTNDNPLDLSMMLDDKKSKKTLPKTISTKKQDMKKTETKKMEAKKAPAKKAPAKKAEPKVTVKKAAASKAAPKKAEVKKAAPAKKVVKAAAKPVAKKAAPAKAVKAPAKKAAPAKKVAAKPVAKKAVAKAPAKKAAPAKKVAAKPVAKKAPAKKATAKKK